jgi:uncharacterized membrane-anchored protein YjiN (DUF445 family)
MSGDEFQDMLEYQDLLGEDTEISSTDETETINETEGEVGEGETQEINQEMHEDQEGEQEIEPLVAEKPQSDVAASFHQDLIEQNKQLMATVQRLMDTAEKKIVPEEKPKDLFEDPAFKDFVEELGVDEVGAAKVMGFLKLMEQRMVQSAVDQAMKATPEVVSKNLQHKETMESIKTKFYEQHEILTEFKPLVGQAAQLLADEHPDWTIQKILEEAANKSYKVLGVDPNKKKELSNSGSEAGKRKTPAFAKTSGARQAPEKKSGFEKELDAMLALEM